MDDLVKDGSIRKDSRIDIARSSIGMAVRAGARKPDITTIDGLKQAILNARSIAVSSQISGIYLTNELFPKLGVAEQAAPKTTKVEKGVAGDLVASGEAEIAFQQISELRAVKGIDYVGPLPASVQRVSVFSAGIAAKAPDPAGAKALLELLDVGRRPPHHAAERTGSHRAAAKQARVACASALRRDLAGDASQILRRPARPACPCPSRTRCRQSLRSTPCTKSRPRRTAASC